MKNIYDNLIPNFSIHQEVDVRSEYKKEIILQKRKTLSERDKLLKIVNTSHNKHWPDGRIYSVAKDGSYSSHSVSPYADSFLKNIEEHIRPLVLALKDKNYLSISSCQGHSIYFKRYITLVFPSKETALEFQSQIPFKRLKFILKHCTEVLNNNLEVDEYGNILDSKKVDRSNHQQGSIDYINCVIKRNYADAWLLEMIISDQVKHEDGWGKYLRNWKEIVFKKFFMESFTKRLTAFVKEKLTTNLY